MFKEAIKNVYKANQVTVMGITGQAGAGKTNHFSPILMKTAQEMGISSAWLGLDSFFILSSKERKNWLNEPGISIAEKAYREDQINWWNYEKVVEALLELRAGKNLKLTNVYNRQDSGELTGCVEIKIDPRGMIIFFDGVGIAHLRKYLDFLFSVYAKKEVRFDRLFSRDNGRRNESEEAKKRFALTENFERPYFREHSHDVDLFIDNSVDEKLQIMKRNPFV